MTGAVVALACVALLAVGAGLVLATEEGSAFGYEVVPHASGTLRLRLTTTSAVAGAWLGVTYYPAAGGGAGQEGSSQVVPLARGKSTTELVVDARYRNGTFEAAVWRRRLSGAECAGQGAACQTLGYKLTNMQAYTWGQLSEAR